MSSECVSPNASSLKKLQEIYQVDEKSLIIFITEWYLKNNVSDYNIEDPAFIDFLDTKFLLKNSQNYYTTKESHKEKHDYWENHLQKGLYKVKRSNTKDSSEIWGKYIDLLHLFGKENVALYSYSGFDILRIAEPKLVKQDTQITKTEEGVEKQEILEEENVNSITIEDLLPTITKLEEAKALVDKMMEDSKAEIVFDPVTHTYTVNGELADTSVTQFIYGKDIEKHLYSEVSASLGNTVDVIVRDYFSDNLKADYPNLTAEMLVNLTKDLQKLKENLDTRFGKDQYGIVTQEFPIASSYVVKNQDGTTSIKIMAGTMDMLIYDNEGNFHIFDVKTKRSNNSKNLTDDNKTAYGKQLALYKAILENKYPELKGKIKTTELILFNTLYPTPTESFPYSVTTTENGINQIKFVTYKNKNPFNIQNIDSSEYNISFNNIVEVEVPTELGITFRQGKTTKNPVAILKHSPEDKQIHDLYNDGTLTSEEISFLSRTAISVVSSIITELQNDKKAITIYFEDKYKNIDFTTKSRQEIIDIVGLTDLFALVKDYLFTPSRNKKITKFKTMRKLRVARENWQALIRIGYSRLIALEKVTVIESDVDNLTPEELDIYIQEMMENEAIEGSTNESWQVGQRHVSAKSGLSANIRRIFEALPILDSNGNTVKDKFGFYFDTYVNSNKAVNSILHWVHNATTIEEMEVTLQNKVTISGNEWLNTILDTIKEEPIRSQFFQNFRKDFTKYSIVKMTKDAKGNYVYTVHIVNTGGMLKSMISEIEFNFREGRMDSLLTYGDTILGDKSKGKVKETEVLNLKQAAAIVNTSLGEYFEGKKANKENFENALNNSLEAVKSFLNILGININEATLKDTVSDYGGVTKYEQTNINKILNTIKYMTNTLLKNKNIDDYNPMAKGKGLYSDYKTLLAILESSVQESIESSVYENGKTYYSFSVPSYMGKMITNLKDSLKDSSKFATYMQNEYMQHKWFYTKENKIWNNSWLESLYLDSKAREQFDYKTQLNFNKVDYPELSELGYTVSLMQEYFYDKSNTLAWYRVPILSNKPSSEFVRFRRITDLKNGNYKNIITTDLQGTLNQEILRIRTVLERAINPKIAAIEFYDVTDDIIAKNKTLFDKVRKKEALTFEDLIDENGNNVLKGSGAEFKFLEAMNKELSTKSELGQLILDKINNEKIDDAELIRLFKESIAAYMEVKVANEIASMGELGIFDTVTNRVNFKNKNKSGVKNDHYDMLTLKYINNLVTPIAENKDIAWAERNNPEATNEEISEIVFQMQLKEAKENIEEYIWNDMFATINIIQMTATDLAYYKNIDNFQKRIAQVHSPSERLNVSAVDSKGNLYSADGKARAMTIEDEVIKSEITDNISTIFDNKISVLVGQKKRDLEIMKDLIISKFNKVNISDGQAYSSPTSYRKKLGMAGKWDSKMEEAYNRIIKGDFNIDDLGILMTPLKPFVYTQVSRNSGASAMSTIKVGVQNKNSEYLLLLADAIIRSGNLPNKLTAIFDFMENSAYDGRVSENGKVIKKGNYNGKGIDTVQFASAVKTGKYGVVNINHLTGYKDIVKALETAAYYNKSRKDDDSNSNDRYDDNFVTTFSFEDYGIQQEVPNHFTNHSQTMGTQMRILGISDVKKDAIYSGKKTGAELVEEYQKLTAENINDSIKILAKELNLDGTSDKVKNIALSKILKNAILKDQRYGPDLLIACSLNTDFEFNVPLSDSIHSTRIQQLLNSIIKSRINKQQVNGGPVVQVSAYGLSDTLNIRFKDINGNLLVTKAEFEANPIEGYNSFKDYLKENQHSVAHFEVYLPIPSQELEDAMTKKDGTFMSLEEAVEKGILPDSMRQAIGYRIPTEDKYSMAPMYIKGFTPKAAGHVVILPREITTLSGSDFDIDKLYIMLKEFRKKEFTNWKQLKTDLFKNFKQDEATKKAISNDFDIIINQIQNGQQFSKDSFADDVNKYYLRNKDRYTKVSFIEQGRDNRGNRNNRMFDINWAVLTNSNTMQQMFNPGSFDTQKRTARIITILKNNTKNYTYAELSAMSLNELNILAEAKEQRSILFSTTQVYLHKQNMTALQLVGIFAKSITSHGFLSLQDIELKTTSNTGFSFDGVTLITSTKIDPIKGFNGTLISRTIAEFFLASVDAGSDPVLNDLNLNAFTVNTAMLLIRLGFDSDSIGLFLTQPVIEKITKDYFKESNEGYVNTILLIQKEIERLAKFAKYTKDDIANFKTKLIDTKFTKEELAIGLQRNNTEFQLKTLLLFQNLLPIAQDLSSISFFTIFNSTKNAAGPNIADTFVLQSKYQKIRDKIENGTFSFSEDAANIINNSPILKAFYDGTISDLSVTKALFKDHFPHYTSNVEAVIESFNNISKDALDAKTINSIVNDYVLFHMTTGENPVIDGSFENRQKYLSKEFIDSLVSAKEKISDNKLLDSIKEKSPTKSAPFYTLETSISGATQDEIENLRNAWDSLMANEDTKQLGLDLFYYNVFRNGFSFSPKTFTHLASTKLKYAIPNYIYNLRNLSKSFENKLDNSNFVDQYLRNHTTNRKLVPKVNTNNKELKVEYQGNTAVIDYGKNILLVDNIIVKSIAFDIKYTPIVIINNNPYKYSGQLGTTVTYSKTTTLGNNNNALEYDANDENMESVLINNIDDNSPEELDLKTKQSEFDDNESDSLEDEVSSETLVEIAAYAIKYIFNTTEIAEVQQINKVYSEALDSKLVEFLQKYVEDATKAEAMAEISKIIDKHNIGK